MRLLGKGFWDKKDKITGIRRADNFAKMAVSASKKACSNIKFAEDDTDTSIILCTQFGPHVTTFKFLDNLLDYSDTGASPLTFSHSVHNAAASYIASSLGIKGQSLTLTSFIDPLKQAFLLADAWFYCEQAKKIIICYVEEESDPLTAAHEYCSFPLYSKKGIITGAAAILIEKGNGIEIPEKVFNPFTYIKEL